MPYLTINSLQVYYETHGEGETLILLHHGFGCTKIWKDIYPALVEAGCRVVMYDRRGYGRSEGGPDFVDFYVSEHFCEDSVRELEDLSQALGLGEVHLVGQCEGGVHALNYARKHPGEVRSVTISSTQCYSTVTMEMFNAEKFPKPFQDLDQDLREKLLDWHGEKHAETSFNQFRRFGGAYGRGVFDLRPVLGSVTCPTLILYPDRSSIFDVEQGFAFYRHLPRGELAVLPRCGHNTYEQRPRDYVRHVLEFLERQQED